MRKGSRGRLMACALAGERALFGAVAGSEQRAEVRDRSLMAQTVARRMDHWPDRQYLCGTLTII